jgi:hypothetical protein
VAPLLAGTDAIGWKYLLVYCCWIFVEAILIWFLWPETSGRSLEELAFLFEGEDLSRRAEKAVTHAVLDVHDDEKTGHHVEAQEKV